jgi:beta-glucosidase
MLALAVGRSVDASPSQVICGVFADTGVPKPVPQTDPEAVQRFEVINTNTRASPHGVVFLGDSLIQKWDHSEWEQNFVTIGALNAGVNGDRTENLLWRIEHGNLDGQQPALVVLLIGTNDIGRNRSARIIAEGVREILLDLRARLPKARILLLGILPRGESPGSRRRLQVFEVNQLIRTCADRESVFYADIGGSLLDRSGHLTREISPDGVHLSERGYERLTDRLMLEINKLIPLKSDRF